MWCVPAACPGFMAVGGSSSAAGRWCGGLKAAWAERFGVAHAVSVNSATSGLYAAMGAIGIQPGDEVIVPPYTMSATALAPLIYGGIPVFADVEPETFCMDVSAVRSRHYAPNPRHHRSQPVWASGKTNRIARPCR